MVLWLFPFTINYNSSNIVYFYFFVFLGLKVQLCRTLLNEMFHGQKSQEWRQTFQSVLVESVCHAHWLSAFPLFNETELKLAYKNCRFSLLIPVEVNLKRKIKQKEWGYRVISPAAIILTSLVNKSYSFSFLRKTKTKLICTCGIGKI